MSQVGITKPRIDIARFKDFVTSETILVVVGAIIVTPILFGVLQAFAINKIPVVRDNLMLSLIITSLILFILATVFKQPMIRALLIGASAGALVSAVQQSSVVQNFLANISARAGT